MVDSVYADREARSGNTSNTGIKSGTITREVSPSETNVAGETNTNSTETITNFDPATQEALNTIIQQLLGGGTSDQQESNKKRQALISFVEQMLGQYSKQAAFDDASNLMKYNLQQSMEKNMPAIAKAIEGAGTSAASMQGLLAQKLATDSATQAGALGAEQAKSYASATTNLAGLLEALTRPDNSIVNSLLSALQIAKGGTVTRNTSQTGTSKQTQSNSGRIETTTMDNGNSSSNLLQIPSTKSNGNNILDRAAAVGYDGDLRDIASYSNSGQSIIDYIN